MAKRAALFVLGLALVLGTFFLYQHFSGPDVLPPKARIGPTTGPTTLPMSYETRDENGVLLYVITAARSPEPIKDENGKPLPGQFLLQSPLATFYEKSGRTIQVRADECRLVIEPGPKKPGGGIAGNIPGGKVAEAITVREGSLKGHVRMTISPRAEGTGGPVAVPATTSAPATATQPTAPAASALARSGSAGTDLLAGGLRIYLDDELHLDGIQEVLSTTGGIHVRGETVAFDGQGMQLVFNRKAQRVEYLGIDKGNQVIIRGVGAKALALAGPVVPATAPATASRPVLPPATSVAASNPATTQVASSQPVKAPPTTYRLSFGQDVRASVGGSKMTSDRLYVIFMAGSELSDAAKAPPAASGPAAPGTVAPAPAGPGGIPTAAAPLSNVPDVPEPIAPATANDLVVQWTGPMEVRPADEKDQKLVDGKDIALEAVGTRDKPVTVTDARFNVQAGRLWYHGAEQRIMLLPEDFGKVVLSDPVRGNVECGEVSINQTTKKAVLTGPGVLLAKSSGGKGEETRVTWKTHMDIDLESTADANDSRKSTFAIRRAQLWGAAVKSDVLDFTADNLDVLIANVVDKGKQIQAMEHLVATGNVVVNSYRKPAAAGAAPTAQGGMQTARMEITTAKAAGSNVPVPAELIAEGDVAAWRWSDRSKGLAAGGGTPESRLQKETITAPKLVATLVPKEKAASPAGAPAPAENGFAGMGQNFDVTHFVASGGAKVEIVPPPASKTGVIVASSATIDAYPDKGTATLTAAEGGKAVRVAIGENAIEGRLVTLDQNTKTFTVPGAGVFNFTLPADGKTRKTAMPLVVTWQESMTYDDVKHLATFAGTPVARVLAADAAGLDQSDQARLECSKTLLVQLKSGVAGAGAAPAGFGESSLGLDWMEAVGNVQAFGAQVGPDNKPLTRLRLSAVDSAVPGKLRYSDSDRAFVVEGPGFMVVENFRPDKAGDQVSASGESDFAWKGGLRYDGGAGTITFTRGVDFFFKPTKAFKFSSGIAAAATAPAGPKGADIVHLQTDKLVATMTKARDATGKTIESPIALGAGGNQDLSKVEATGGAQMYVGTYQTVNGQMTMSISYHVAGGAMTFDVPTNVASMIGTVDEPAVAEEPVSGQRIMGRQIDLNLTKDRNYFHVEGMSGNLNMKAFGG